MSADNWTICPRCEAKELERVKALKLKAGESYGKVPPEEYLKLLEEAGKPFAINNSLREDYELGIHKGKFYVSYRGRCTCGLTHEFKHEEEIA